RTYEDTRIQDHLEHHALLSAGRVEVLQGFIDLRAMEVDEESELCEAHVSGAVKIQIKEVVGYRVGVDIVEWCLGVAAFWQVFGVERTVRVKWHLQPLGVEDSVERVVAGVRDRNIKKIRQG